MAGPPDGLGAFSSFRRWAFRQRSAFFCGRLPHAIGARRDAKTACRPKLACAPYAVQRRVSARPRLSWSLGRVQASGGDAAAQPSMGAHAP